MRPSPAFALLALALAASGCVGKVRETTTARTATEQLLLSTAAERAIERFATAEKVLAGVRVAIDDSKFESYDKPYVVSALRHYVAERGARLAAMPAAAPTAAAPAPDLILEVRSGALGIDDKSWGIGIPPFPMPVPNSSLVTETPPMYLVYREKQVGWAKFQLWLYDPARGTYVAKSGDLWGTAYASQWWILFAGPFDFSNDVYPDEDDLGPRSRGG